MQSGWINKMVKEKENKIKESQEMEKNESFQGDVIEDDSNLKNSQDFEKEEIKESQWDDKPLVDSGSAEKEQDDSGKVREKPTSNKSNPVLSPQEMKNKLSKLDFFHSYLFFFSSNYLK